MLQLPHRPLGGWEARRHLPPRPCDPAIHRFPGKPARRRAPVRHGAELLSPHDPYSAPKHFYEPYRGRGIPFAGYYAAVSALDHNLAAIRDALARTGLAGNTT